MAVTIHARNLAVDGVLQAQLAASLHSGDPGTSGANELSGGGYARAAITFPAATNGQAANSNAPTWVNLPAGTVTHIGLWRSGQFVAGAAFTQPRTVEAGEGLYMPSGSWTLSVTG